jgi:hypothetical protein
MRKTTFKHLHVRLEPIDEGALAAGLAAFRQLGDATIRVRADFVRQAVHALAAEARARLDEQQQKLAA